MRQYNLAYKKYIDEKNTVSPLNMVRNRFYLIKKYNYIDGDKVSYTETDAPIIYTIFVSKALDEVHCVKVTNLAPQTVKALFGRLLNENTNELEIKGRSKKIYTSIIEKIPKIGQNAYRTYKLSGLKKVLQLDMDIEKITPIKPAIPPKQKIPPKKSK